jgi:prevent-host-death family protein
VADAKNKLPELIKAVENGQRVTICRRGVPIVDLVRTKERVTINRRFGTLRDRVKQIDPNWWTAMTEKEAEAFMEGRY